MLNSLTPRERQVFERLVQGENSKEIASGLYRSVKTVDIHVYNILHKLSCPDRAKLIARHWQEKLQEAART